MNGFKFKLLHQDKKTLARVGEIITLHGVIKTPCFVPVGTQATVKSLTPEELQLLDVELFFVNTYHAYLRPGIEVIKKIGGLHKFMNWQKPLITDSGGFQVFSLGRKDRKKKYCHNASKTGLTCSTERNDIYNWQKANLLQTDIEETSNYKKSHAEFISASNPSKILNQVQDDKNPVLVKITDNGVKFQSHWDGTTHEFTPEKSMQLQWDLGSDIHIAFDDCTPYPVTHEQAVKSLERTHTWAKRSLAEHNKLAAINIYSSIPPIINNNRKAGEKLTKISSRSRYTSGDSNNNHQALYGVVQGSIFENLRKKSADFITNMDFDGIAIGGVSVGESKDEMKQVCDWVVPRLPDDKPRHLLGVGEIDDIFDIIERGIDTFDCVAPTRLARMGHIFSISNIKNSRLSGIRDAIIAQSSQTASGQKFTIDITKTEFASDVNPLEQGCGCYTCRNFSRAYIHHLFKVRELLAYRLATIHNLHFVINLVKLIRQSIMEDRFLQFKQEFFKIR